MSTSNVILCLTNNKLEIVRAKIYLSSNIEILLMAPLHLQVFRNILGEYIITRT